MPAMAKRPAEDEAQEAPEHLESSMFDSVAPPDEGPHDRKMPRTTPRDGDWTCPQCGNLNYSDRAVCNMRKCGASRPAQDWICHACGNSNYADREFCNMRRCRAPRGPHFGVPGLVAGLRSAPVPRPCSPDPAAMVVHPPASHVAHFVEPRMLTPPPPPAPPRPGGAHPSKQHQGFQGVFNRPQREGDWICPECQNVNFSDRAFCNMRKCGQPRILSDWLCPACGNTNYADRIVCNMRKCGAPRQDAHPKVIDELMQKGMVKGRGRGDYWAAAGPGVAEGMSMAGTGMLP